MTVELLNLTEAEYRALPGINWSSLKHMAVSPAQYKWEIDHPQPASAAMSLGTVEHIALMTPEDYLRRKEIIDVKRGTKAFDKYILGLNPDIIFVTQEEHEMILLHIERFRANKHYAQITENAKIEQALRWTDEETGIVCKGRPDMFNDLILPDFKTSRHIEDRKWWWDFKDRKYHCQFAYYHDALKLLDGRNRVNVVVKLETTPCFDVVVYPLSDTAITEGRSHYRRLLNELRDCLEADAWPGKCDELATVDFHNWVIDKTD